MNKDPVTGRIKEATGKAHHEAAGRTGGSPRQEIKAKVKKNVGKAQKHLSDAADPLKEDFESDETDTHTHRP